LYNEKNKVRRGKQMAETEKIRFMGYNLDHEKWDTTISGVYDRSVTDVEVTLSTMDKLRYDHVFLADKYNEFVPIHMKRIELSLVTEGIFHSMSILLQGVAYVMNQHGDTVDTIKSKKENV